jgi:hypothetical protein
MNSGTLHSHQNAWRDRFAVVPFEDRGGYFQSRYYQDIAIDRVLEAIAENRQRILLTLATGTGKTFIAFQIAWKLFHSRWNLSGETFALSQQNEQRVDHKDGRHVRCQGDEIAPLRNAVTNLLGRA